MASHYGSIVKKLREEKNRTQTEISDQLFISRSTYSRIEKGDIIPDYSVFVSLMQLLGETADNYTSVLYNKDDYYGYTKLVDLRCAVRDGKLAEAKIVIEEVDGSPSFRKGLRLQFLLYAKVMTDESLDNQNAMDKLLEAILITKKDFRCEAIRNYLLSYNEIIIIDEMANRYFNNGEQLKAINMLKAVRDSMDENYINEQEKANTYPVILYNLSNFLGITNQYEEALEICYKAKKVALKYNKLKILPYILYNIASALQSRGDDDGCKIPLVQAYHTACAMEDFSFAKVIKKDASETFGIQL